MLHLCGYDGSYDTNIESFLCFAYKHLHLFQSFLHLKLTHYNSPLYKPEVPFADASLCPTVNTHTLGMRHIAILDLLSSESRKQLVLAPN